MLWQMLIISSPRRRMESSTESLIVVNAKDIGVLIRLPYMTLDNANDIFVVLHISKQAKWATKREVWPIQDVGCHFGRGLCQSLYSSIIHSHVKWMWYESSPLWNVKNHEQFDPWWMCAYIHQRKFHTERCCWGRSRYEIPNWWQWHW